MEPNWLTAIATIVLAMAALASILRDEIRALLVHPDFKLRFTPGIPDCHVVPVRWRENGALREAQAHYVRCRVRNTGKVAARDIEVTVKSIRRRVAAGTMETEAFATPWNLLWSHHGTHVLPQLPPETERHITIGHVVDPAHRDGMPYEHDPHRTLASGATLFALEVHAKSNTLEYLLSPGEYEVDLEVAAANAKPREFTFRLNHTGTWFPTEQKMYSDGLGMSLKQ